MVFGKKSKDDDTSSNQWKKKYYDSLDDIEHKEEEWHQVEKLLRNAVVRISLASDPSQERLTKLLNALRDDIRNGKNSLNLKVQLDKIIAVIRDLDSIDETPGQSEYSAKELVNECIERIQWTERAQKFKRGLSRQFNNIKENEVQKFIHSFTKLLNQELLWYDEEVKASAKQNSSPPSSDLDKETLVGKNSLESNIEKIVQDEKDVTNDLPLIDGAESVIEYPAILLTLLKKIPSDLLDSTKIRKLQLRAASSKTRQDAIDAIDLITSSFIVNSSENYATPDISKQAVQLLIEFLELVTLPDSLSPQAEEIRQTLISEPDQLKECLNQTVELVMTLQLELKNERKELEIFLSELSSRLQEIDDEVKKLSGISTIRAENVEQASTHLNETADSIDKFLNEETNIDNLKDSVKSHVIMIRHHMDTFTSEDNTQQKYSDKVVHQLAKELMAVKAEAERLRAELEQKRLQATHDTLTRIPNRLAYDEWIEQEHDRYVKYDTPFVLMVWDVDFFKRVNDEFGHQAGDKVLRIVAQMLAENIRDADFVARYGGEEFVVVLPGTTLDAAMKVANKIRLAIEACAFHFRDKPVKVTASAGVTEIRENETVKMLFDRADQALYKAKESGRNICIAG